jgi:hypothetical protein
MKNYKMTVRLITMNNSDTVFSNSNDIFETVVAASNPTRAKQQVEAMYGGPRKCQVGIAHEVR